MIRRPDPISKAGEIHKYVYICGLFLRLAYWPLHALLWNDLFRSGATNGIDCQDYSSRNLRSSNESYRYRSRRVLCSAIFWSTSWHAGSFTDHSGIYCGVPLLRCSTFFVFTLESMARDPEAKKKKAWKMTFLDIKRWGIFPSTNDIAHLCQVQTPEPQGWGLAPCIGAAVACTGRTWRGDKSWGDQESTDFITLLGAHFWWVGVAWH